VNISEISYRTKTANEREIESHLDKCKGNFFSRLDARVNIREYSRRIHDKSITFEAWVNNELIGLVAAYFNDMVDHSGYITNVSVTKDYMGLGIASELMKMSVDYAEQHNFKDIRLEIQKNNSSAINLYRKFGFVDCEERDDFLLLKLVVNKS